MNTKVVFWVIAILVLIPVVKALWPKPMTFDRIEKGFVAQGLVVKDIHDTAPSLEAAAQHSMTIEGADVEVYQYDDEGKIAKELTYQQPDPGQAMVEASGLRQALGAAPLSPIKTDATRRGMFMVTVSSENADLRMRVLKAFKAL